MFANIISKRALSMSRMVGSQVRPLTSIYGVEMKSTAKFSYSAAQKISPLDFCTKREKHSESTKDLQDGSKKMPDYKDYVILAEAMIEADFDKRVDFRYIGTETCIHNTLWKVYYDEIMGNWESRHDYFTARLEDIHPRNETCHAEILFIDEINSITHKFYDKFGLRNRKRIPRYGVGGIREFMKNEIFEHRAAVIRVLEEKQKFLKEFDNRWAKDVTFVVNGEKCAGDRQYLSAISPVFKKMLQDHAQDEITLEGVESADVLKDFFLAISPLRVQPNPTNVVSLLKLAQDYDIPFLMRSCEEHLKNCYEMSIADRIILAVKYNLNDLHKDMTKNLENGTAKLEQKRKELKKRLEKFEHDVQPNPTNVVSLLKLAHDFDIPFLMRSCEEHLKQCSEIPAIDRFLLAMKYELNGLKLSTEKSLNSDDLVKILGALNVLEQKQEVLERVSNNDLAEILGKRKDMLSKDKTEFLLQNITERLGNCYCGKEHKLEYISL
ncbi:BTB/POZ domain-containing protein [Ditylenchus destructor]|nr:BTB/POZ domain-containing protein [Ditylenchus destructor]